MNSLELRIADIDYHLERFTARRLLAEATCTATKYEKCFSKCPPMIPGPPPPPLPSLINYQQPWCKGHTSNWTCFDTNAGPNITGRNPRLEGPFPSPNEGSGDDNMVVLSVILPLIIVLVIAFIIVGLIWRRKRAMKNREDNTYNLGYMNKPTGPAWADNDGTEGAVEDGSEIFYQVDRSAIAAGMNAGAGRSMPDVVHSSTATLRKSPDIPIFDIGRSGSAASQTPLLSSPIMSSRFGTQGNRRIGRHLSGGTEGNGELSVVNQPNEFDNSMQYGSNAQNTGRYMSSGFNTYSPNHSKSHPALYKKNSSNHGDSTINTPRTARNRSFGSGDVNKPRALRKQSNATVQRSDSMTLNRAADRENYKSNWDNFDEVTATMKRNRTGPSNRELVLTTDSFIDSFTTPDQEDTTTVDQLGLPTRNPFLTGYYDDDYPSQYNDDNVQDETDFANHPPIGAVSSPPPYRDNGPPAYEDSVTRRVLQKNSHNGTPTSNGDHRVQNLTIPDMRARNNRISEYDSEASIEV